MAAFEEDVRASRSAADDRTSQMFGGRMKLPSITQVAVDAARTLRRFPIVLLNAAAGTAAAVILLEHEGPAQSTILFKVLFAAVLGMPLLIMIALSAEKRRWSAGAALAAQCAGVLALAAYAWTIPSDLSNAPEIHYYRLLLIAAGLHFCVAVVPFAGPGGTNGFWHYNKALLMRAITAGLFSGVLYAGLAVALAALDNLFGVTVGPKRYGELWIVTVGMFMTWFFLGGVPEDLDALEESGDYPTVIKIFAQYILLPLVLVYLVILYAYTGKILLSWEWPRGWVSGLILGFATAGMLMQLLFHPIRDRAENVWIKNASRWFYLAMVPLVAMLLMAVWRRVSEYGVTEGRYIAVVTGLWLAAIVLYFIVSRDKSIKAIPASLGAVALAVSFGPWGAFAVSESSQVERLREILTRTSVLVDGTVRPPAAPVPFEETKQISSIIEYLHNVHGYDRIQPWFRERLRTDPAGGSFAYKDPAAVTKMMGVDYVRVWEGTAQKDINLKADTDRPLEIGGYDRLCRLQISSSSTYKKEIVGGGLSYRTTPGLDTLSILTTEQGKPADSLRIDVRQLIERVQAEYKNTNTWNIPPERMSVAVAEGRMRVKLCLHQVFARRDDAVLKITMYECTILYSIAALPPP